MDDSMTAHLIDQSLYDANMMDLAAKTGLGYSNNSAHLFLPLCKTATTALHFLALLFQSYTTKYRNYYDKTNTI